MPKFSQSSLEKLNTCDSRLQSLFTEVVKHYDCQVLQGFRGQKEQDKAFAEGKSQKKWPNGNHNKLPSTAIDVAPYPVDWNDSKRFYYFAGFVMGVAAKMGLNIRYGGDWDMDKQIKDNKFDDLVHFEIID